MGQERLIDKKSAAGATTVLVINSATSRRFPDAAVVNSGQITAVPEASRRVFEDRRVTLVQYHAAILNDDAVIFAVIFRERAERIAHIMTLEQGKRIGNESYFFEAALLADVPDDAEIITTELSGRSQLYSGSARWTRCWPRPTATGSGWSAMPSPIRTPRP